jgi:hypothetical protein
MTLQHQHQKKHRSQRQEDEEKEAKRERDEWRAMEAKNEEVKICVWSKLLLICCLEDAPVIETIAKNDSANGQQAGNDGAENPDLNKTNTEEPSDYDFGQANEISKYLLLNKGLRSFIKLIVDHSPSDESAPVISSADEKILWRGFDAYKDVIAHKKKLYNGRFKWDSWEGSLENVSALIHRYVKNRFPLYPQIVDPEIFQLVFPVKLIKAYMYSPFLGDYLKPAEFKPVLTLQTDLARLFLIFHLKADTKYLAKTDSDQLGILDPFFRTNMRFKNRLEPMFAKGGKYNCRGFDIKEFICQCIKLFFQPLGFCEITGYDFYLQSTILEIFRYTLELGIWKYQELRGVVKLLFEKTQALISFRERYLVEIIKHQNDTEQTETLMERVENTKDNGFTKTFLDECREQCAAICLQIIFLINDDELYEAFHSKDRYNPKDSEYIEKAWEFGYFSNIEFNYLINSIFTSFIIKFKPDKNNKNLSKMTNKILMLITDRANDDFVSSMNMVEKETFLGIKRTYVYEVDPMTHELKAVSNSDSDLRNSGDTKRKIMAVLDAVTKGEENGNIQAMERMTKDLKDEWEKRTKGKKPDEIQKYKMALACENVPALVVTVANLVMELTTFKTDKCSNDLIGYLLDICDNNDIGISLLFCYSSIDKMKAWNFDDPIKIAFTLRYLLASDTTEPYQLLYSHTSVFDSVLEAYSVTFELFEESLGGGSFDQNEYYDYWSEKPGQTSDDIQDLIQEKKIFQRELLLSIYLYNTMFIDLIRKGNDTFHSKYYDFEILQQLTKFCNRVFSWSGPVKSPHDELGHEPDSPLASLERLKPEEFQKVIHLGRGDQTKDNLKWEVLTIMFSCVDLGAKCTRRGFTLHDAEKTTQWVNQASANLDFPKLTSKTIQLLRFRGSFLEGFGNLNLCPVSSCSSLPNSLVIQFKIDCAKAERERAERERAKKNEGQENKDGANDDKMTKAEYMKVDMAEKIDLMPKLLGTVFKQLVQEMEYLKTLCLDKVFLPGAEKNEDIIRAFRKYFIHGLFPTMYKTVMIILHYSRSEKSSIESHIMNELGKDIENFCRAYSDLRASNILEKLVHHGVLFDSSDLAVLVGLTGMSSASEDYAFELLGHWAKKVGLFGQGGASTGSQRTGGQDMKEMKEVKDKREVRKDYSDPELDPMKKAEEEKRKELKESRANLRKKTNLEMSGVPEELREMKPVNQWWKTSQGEDAGRLSEELIISYDLDEEEARSEWMEAVTIVFANMAAFIEYNHQEADRDVTYQKGSCSKILEMFRREMPSFGSSVKNSVFSNCKLNHMSSGCLEKFYKDHGNLQDVASRDIPRNDFKRFEHLRLLYREKKRSQITKAPRENHFLLFLNSQKGKGEAIIYYIVSVINFYVKEKLDSKEVVGEGEIRRESEISFALLTDEYILSLNIFLDNMFFEHEFFIQCLLNIVKGGYLEYEDLKVHAERILSQHIEANKHFKKHADQNDKKIEERLIKRIEHIEELEKVGQEKMKEIGREYLSINYFIIMNFGRSCAFRIFVESNWKNLWDRFYISTNIFKNICESNNQTFKVFLSDFKPEIEDIKILPHPEEDMLLDDFFDSGLRPLMESNSSWRNVDVYEQPSDQVDKFPVIQRYLEIFSVFVNEGCLRNQSTFFSLGEEYWPGIMRRMPDDVNSNFYKLKITVIKYLISLTDKSSEIISNYIAYNFPPSYISELIYVHMKKLYCYAILENDPTQYKELKEKIQLREEEDIREEKRKWSEEINNIMERRKTMNQEQLGLQKVKDRLDIESIKAKKPGPKHAMLAGKVVEKNESKYFPISAEMCDLVPITKFSQIKDAYLYNPSMYGHPLLELCVQLNLFIDTLAKQSSVYKLYQGYLNTQILNIYGAETPGRLRKELKTDVAYAGNDRPETIEIHMALATFTEVIEVQKEEVITRSSNDQVISKNEHEKEPTNKVLFLIPPESFLLTPEMKEKILQGVPVDQVVKVVQEKFHFMSIQMKNSLKMYRKWKWLFLLSSPEIMNVHKKIIWTVSFAINILLGLRNSITLQNLSEGILAGINPIQLAINALAIANSIYSLLQLITWTLNKYREVVETVALEIEHAESKVLTMSNRTKSWIHRAFNSFNIYVLSPFFTKDSPLMFLLQAIFNMLGAYFSDFFFTLNLWMVILLGSNVRQMIISIRDNWAKMLLTLALTLFVTYSTGFIGAAAGGVKRCETIWGCFTQVLGFSHAEGATGGSEAIITNLIFGTMVTAFSAQQKDDKEIGIL